MTKNAEALQTRRARQAGEEAAAYCSICESTQTDDLVEAEAPLVVLAMSLDARHCGLVSETKRRKLGVQAILLHRYHAIVARPRS
jgi:hypothetical protein